MLIILPPSETKRDGGVPETSLDLSALSFPALTRPRKAALAALKRLSRNLKASTGALSLGAGQRFEIDRNRAIETSPLMPAIDRYTGVLYEGFGSGTVDASRREFLGRSTVIHSALFGIIGALDPIPAYRLSHNSRLPGLSLRKHWRQPIAELLAGVDGLILDLRSEAYAELGPAPTRTNSFYLRVVSEAEGGQRKALTHFNKKGKGEFARAVIDAEIDHADGDSLIAWAADHGFRLAHGAPGELELLVQR